MRPTKKMKLYFHHAIGNATAMYHLKWYIPLASTHELELASSFVSAYRDKIAVDRSEDLCIMLDDTKPYNERVIRTDTLQQMMRNYLGIKRVTGSLHEVICAALSIQSSSPKEAAAKAGV